MSEKAPANELLDSQEIDDLWLEYSALTTDAERKSFVDQHVVALTKTYVLRHPQLQPPLRTQLIELICAFRDPRTEPALRTALQSFVQRRPTAKADADIQWVLRAAADLKLFGLSQPLIEAYQVFEAHTMLGGVTYKDFARALIEIADPSWAPTLRAKLDAEIRRPKTREEVHLIDAYRDQLFWQTSAAQVLGIIRDREAVDPLFRVLLDPAKLDVAGTAVLALVQIGKPARTAAAQLLLGEHPVLAEYYEAHIAAATGEPPPAGADAHVEVAAGVLGISGHAEARAPMLEFLKAGPKPKPAVSVAAELGKLPPNNATKDAFKTVLFATPKTLDIREGMPARAMLLESAVGFYDPVVVEWCLDTLRSEVATGERAEETRAAGLTTALNLVDRERLPRLRRVVDAQKEPEFRKRLDEVAMLVNACKESASCYLGELSKESLPQILALKAGYMVGIYGDESSLDALIALLDQYQDAVRFVLTRTLDTLTPNGSPEVVQKLQQIVDADQASGDPDRILGDAAIKQIMYRIEGRSR